MKPQTKKLIAVLCLLPLCNSCKQAEHPQRNTVPVAALPASSPTGIQMVEHHGEFKNGAYCIVGKAYNDGPTHSVAIAQFRVGATPIHALAKNLRHGDTWIFQIPIGNVAIDYTFDRFGIQ